jgi:hypothetical protein
MGGAGEQTNGQGGKFQTTLADTAGVATQIPGIFDHGFERMERIARMVVRTSELATCERVYPSSFHPCNPRHPFKSVVQFLWNVMGDGFV